MELIIQLVSGETKAVHVNLNATIGDLRLQIAPLFTARASQLKLSITNGQTLQLDDDQKKVSDYGLRSGSTVMLLISTTLSPLQVFVKNEKGQMKSYDITEDETTDQLMRKVQQKEGAPVDQQRLIFNGRQLESGRKLQDYGIVSGSTIYMLFRLRGG